MDRGATRLGAATLALAASWIVLFWWTPKAEQDGPPRVSFGRAPEQQALPGPFAIEPEPVNKTPTPIAVKQPSQVAVDLLTTAQAAVPAVKIERVVRHTSDAQRVTREDAAPLRAPEPIEPEPVVQHYTVRSGDTLSEIAQEFYGRSVYWRLIRDANIDLVGEQGRLLQPGQILVIPDRAANAR